MKKMRLSILSLVAVHLASCGSGGSGGGTRPQIQIPCLRNHGCRDRIVGDSTNGGHSTIDATVSNATNTAVTWSVSGETGGNATVGTISDSGLDTAPDTVPTPDTLTITATSRGKSRQTGSATVTIVSLDSGVNDALLTGRYAFVFSGSEDTSGVFVAGGTFAADGNGNITDGREDGNFAGGTFAEQPFAGIYSIGADRRGTMIIANTAGADCGCARTQFTFKFNVVSDQTCSLHRVRQQGAGKGTIEKQDTAAFSFAAIDGPYAFLLDGLDFNNRLSIAGRFSSISGALSQAIADINNAQTISTAQDINGALTLGANGRGTATLTTPVGELHFAYYIVSNDKLVCVGTDFFPILSGTALRQTSSPFSNASLLGKYIWDDSVHTSSPAKGDSGRRGILRGGWRGAAFRWRARQEFPLGRNGWFGVERDLCVSANGRGTAALNTEVGAENIVFYMASESEGIVLQVDASETDLNNVTSGRLRRQDTTVFSVASWQGPYGLFVTGSGAATDPTQHLGDVGGGRRQRPGHNAGHLRWLLHPDESLTGTYEVQATGRGTAAFPTSDFNVYIASSSDIFLIGINPGEVRFGTALKQE